ncbi:endo alpha-1,4 polygalactosaminidase, partial [Alcanivorax sp. HI0083]
MVEPDQADSLPQAYRDETFYAYVSLGEVLSQRHYFAGLDKAWLLGKNPDWGSFILDQSSPALRSYFIDAVIEPLWAKGYRGFFLDTLDSYQLVAKDEAARERQRQGLAALINAIAERHPQAGFIFNRGFELMPLVQARVDAVAAESLYQRWLPDKDQFTAVP